MFVNAILLIIALIGVTAFSVGLSILFGIIVGAWIGESWVDLMTKLHEYNKKHRGGFGL